MARKIAAELDLQHPVVLGDDEYTKFEFREACGADLEEFPMVAPKIGDMLRLAARLAEVPYPVMKKLNWADVGRVLAAVGEMQGGGPETGEISPPS